MCSVVWLLCTISIYYTYFLMETRWNKFVWQFLLRCFLLFHSRFVVYRHLLSVWSYLHLFHSNPYPLQAIDVFLVLVKQTPWQTALTKPLFVWGRVGRSFFWLTGHRKGDIANKYPLYKVYMGLIIKGIIPRVPAFFLWTGDESNYQTFGSMTKQEIRLTSIFHFQHSLTS